MQIEIGFRNFRAFQNAEISLRPMNILMGTNGSGKSSVLQLIMMLSQSSSLIDESSNSAIKINGPLCSFGSVENIFNLKDTRKELVFDFTISEKIVSDVKDQVLSYAFKEIQNLIERGIYYLEFLSSRAHDKNFDENVLSLVERSERWSRKREENYTLKEYKDKCNFYVEVKDLIKKSEELFGPTENEKIAFRLSRRRIARDRKSHYNRYRPRYELHQVSLVDIDISQKLISEIFNFSGGCRIVYELKVTNNSAQRSSRINISNISFYSHNQLFCSFDGGVINSAIGSKESGDGNPSFFDHYKSARENLFDLNASIFEVVYQADYDELSVNILSKWLGGLESKVRNYFHSREVAVVKPLRGYPRRYYDAYGSDLKEEAFEIINVLKHNQEAKEFINNWVGRFDIEMDASEYEDFLGKIYTRRRVNGVDLNVDLIDSGFGYSQVLPILYKGLIADKDAIFIVEQPEIHLHPNMQAELADFFIDLYNFKRKEEGGNFTIIIETHSEYLIKRFARRIAEKQYKSYDHKSISPGSEEVGLFFIESSSVGDGAGIRFSEINKFGGIEWPKDFFEARDEDLKATIKSRMRMLGDE